MEERGNGFFERLIDVYGLISEKGLFWAFDNMVETGELPYEAVQSHFSGKKPVSRPIALGSEEIGDVLGQVIGTLGLAPVHLVLHDSSLNMVANWVAENPDLVRSVTLLDTGSSSAFPLWVLQVPLVREVVLGFGFVYQGLIESCCSKGITNLDSERMVLRNGRRAVVGTETMMNCSFDVADWGSLDALKGKPMQVVWSRSWSKEWSEEGRRVSVALPQAKFVKHSGGRWPQKTTNLSSDINYVTVSIQELRHRNPLKSSFCQWLHVARKLNPDLTFFNLVSFMFTVFLAKPAMLLYLPLMDDCLRTMKLSFVIGSQDDTAEEIADHVSTFVSSLPKSVREAEEKAVPEHIQKMLDEAKQNPDHHHHHHGHSGHDHAHGSDGYADAYGLGQAWDS
ncbi:Protein AUXIN RESPONSE 4 [Linum perenne]